VTAALSDAVDKAAAAATTAKPAPAAKAAAAPLAAAAAPPAPAPRPSLPLLGAACSADSDCASANCFVSSGAAPGATGTCVPASFARAGSSASASGPAAAESGASSSAPAAAPRCLADADCLSSSPSPRVCLLRPSRLDGWCVPSALPDGAPCSVDGQCASLDCAALKASQPDGGLLLGSCKGGASPAATRRAAAAAAAGRSAENVRAEGCGATTGCGAGRTCARGRDGLFKCVKGGKAAGEPCADHVACASGKCSVDGDAPGGSGLEAGAVGVCLPAGACRSDQDCRQPDSFCSLPTVQLPKAAAAAGAAAGGRRLAAAAAVFSSPLSPSSLPRRMLQEMMLVGAGNLDGTVAVLGGPAPTPNKEAGTTPDPAKPAAAAAEKPAPAAPAATAVAAATPVTPPATPYDPAAAPGTCTPRRKPDGARCQADAECGSGWCGEARCDSAGACGGACAPRPPTLSAASAVAP
jgi:hypothetical protein